MILGGTNNVQHTSVKKIFVHSVESGTREKVLEFPDYGISCEYVQSYFASVSPFVDLLMALCDDKCYKYLKLINPLQPGVAYIYPLKTSENLNLS